MAVNLSSTNSIVDYLSTQNKDASFAARKKLYNEMGLNNRLGDYVGSSNQNINFLNALKTPTTPFVPGNSPLKVPETPVATDTVNTVSQPVAQPAVQQAQTSTQPPIQTPQPTTATDALNTFGYTPPPKLTPEQVMNQAQATPEAQLAGEKQDLGTLKATSEMEVEKQKLQSEFNTAKNKIENNYNLSFSGARGKALQDLTTNLATSMLGADRELAVKLLESDIGAREKFLSIAEKVVKQADDNNKTALDQMNKAGYSIVGGKVMPTVEALRVAQTAGTAEFNQMIQLERLKISSRLANTAQERNSILNQLRAVSLQQKTAVSPGQVVNKATGLPVDLTQGESESLQRQQTVKDYYIPTLQTMLQGVDSGAVSGKVNKYAATMPVVQYLRNEDLSMFNAMASYMSMQIVYMNSGKQINEVEMQKLQQSLPNAELTTSENLKRLKQFNDITSQVFDRTLTLNGWTISDNPNNNVITDELGGTGDFSEIDDFLNSF